MGTLIEGRNAVLEALRSATPLERVYVSDALRRDAQDEGALASLIRAARSARVDVEFVPKRWLDERSERGAHQGVAALAAPFAFTPLASILDRAADKAESLLFALDQVTDAGNLGAIARSAEVAGADGLVITKRRAASITTGAYKTSAGALSWLPVVQEPNLVRALESCKARGYWVVGATEDAPRTIWQQPLEGRLVIVLGAEGTGLSRLTAEACDFTASLPVRGHVGSLNVAQAAAVFAYEWVRRQHGQA